jgi:hypothetical protein
MYFDRRLIEFGEVFIYLIYFHWEFFVNLQASVNRRAASFMTIYEGFV